MIGLDFQRSGSDSLEEKRRQLNPFQRIPLTQRRLPRSLLNKTSVIDDFLSGPVIDIADSTGDTAMHRESYLERIRSFRHHLGKWEDFRLRSAVQRLNNSKADSNIHRPVAKQQSRKPVASRMPYLASSAEDVINSHLEMRQKRDEDIKKRRQPKTSSLVTVVKGQGCLLDQIQFTRNNKSSSESPNTFSTTGLANSSHRELFPRKGCSQSAEGCDSIYSMKKNKLDQSRTRLFSRPGRSVELSRDCLSESFQTLHLPCISNSFELYDSQNTPTDFLTWNQLVYRFDANVGHSRFKSKCPNVEKPLLQPTTVHCNSPDSINHIHQDYNDSFSSQTDLRNSSINSSITSKTNGKPEIVLCPPGPSTNQKIENFSQSQRPNLLKTTKQNELREKELKNLFADIKEIEDYNRAIISK